MIIRVFLYWNWKDKNHMNIDKKNHPQLLRQEQPCIWPMVTQIGLGTGMYVSTYSVLFRFGIFVSLNCIPFQFLCTFHFVSFRSVSVNFVTFHFVSFCFGKFRYVSFRFAFHFAFYRYPPRNYQCINSDKGGHFCLPPQEFAWVHNFMDPKWK
jgi:hypothetical protein